MEGIRRATDTSSFSWHKFATKTPSPSSSYTLAGTEDIRDIFGLTKTIDLAECGDIEEDGDNEEEDAVLEVILSVSEGPIITAV
jgi:hypothetical protein